MPDKKWPHKIHFYQLAP